jgi:hypothetical protein
MPLGPVVLLPNWLVEVPFGMTWKCVSKGFA